MSDPSPEEVAGFFDDPEFIRLPPGCGTPHPTLPNIFCGKDEGCLDYHLAVIPQPDLSRKHEAWDNEKKTPKPEKKTNQAKVRDIGGRTGAVNPTAGTPAKALAEALTRVEESADADFKDEARAALERVARSREFLTSEDVLDIVSAVTHDNRAMGPIMLWGKRNGLIEKTERFDTYRKVENHQMDSRIWRSLVFQISTPTVLQDFG